MSDTPQEAHDRQTFGEAFREIREQQGLSVREVAEAAEEDETRIAALEAGEVDPKYATILALADAIGVPSATFFVRAEEIESRAAATGG